MHYYVQYNLLPTCRHGRQAAVEHFHSWISDGYRGQDVLTCWRENKNQSWSQKTKRTTNARKYIYSKKKYNKIKKVLASYVQCCWPWCPWRSARWTSWIPPQQESVPEAQSWPAGQWEKAPEQQQEMRVNTMKVRAQDRDMTSQKKVKAELQKELHKPLCECILLMFAHMLRDCGCSESFSCAVQTYCKFDVQFFMSCDHKTVSEMWCYLISSLCIRGKIYTHTHPDYNLVS